VWLEVTERGQFGEDATVATASLRASGVRFALDDFGSSYSNLAYLKQFPAESLKIDKSFVEGVTDESVDRSIVRAIVAMARSLSMGVVAEGIERPAQRDALIALGCRFGQGYLFAPALSAKEATRLLVPPDPVAAADRNQRDRSTYTRPPGNSPTRTLAGADRPRATETIPSKSPETTYPRRIG
jgi:EAL domain-containing protein (putative c-di-GMP-specific phosphodiesterase class I)